VFEKFTAGSRKVLGLSRQEAVRLGSEFIGVEHILMGLLSAEDLGSVRVFRHIGLDPGLIRAEVEKHAPGSDRKGPTQVQLPFSPDSKRLIEASDRTAIAMKHDDIATCHLLMADLDDPQGILAKVLPRLGLEPADVRRRVREALETAGK
jgi:ATP-dependent Clp protease ATP-binding subunit ClpC